MKKLPFGKSKDDGRPKANRVSPSPLPWINSKPRPVTTYIPDSAPSLPPLPFGPEGASTSKFDLADMLVDTTSKELPPPPVDSSSTQNTFILRSRSEGRRGSSSVRAGNRLSTINETQPTSESVPVKEGLSTSKDSIPTSFKGEDDTKTAEAATIRELKMELAKYNPMSPLLHGVPQQEYGLLLQKSGSLEQQLLEMEEVLQGLHVKKDLIVMDLEAMEVALRVKEGELAESNKAELPRFNTAHNFMKQTYQMEVKELQDQKAHLREEIQDLKGQRDEILNEMKILSVRNMELSTMNDTLASEQPLETESKPRIEYTLSVKSSAGIIGSLAEKMRRPRPTESSIDSPSWTVGNNNRSSIAPNLSTSVDLDEEPMTRKNNRRKSTKTTGIGAMFEKLLETPTAGSSLEVPPTLAPSRRSQDEEGRSSGQHYFVLYNFVRPVRCNGCEEMIWGREYKCLYCGYQSHTKCTQFAYTECRRSSCDDPSREISRRRSSDHEVLPVQSKYIMFGNDLQDQLEREQQTIPLVVENCIEAVDTRGLEVEGIYRRSGMAAESRRLVEAFNSDRPPNLRDPEIYQDICSVTSVLKQFLRSLPEPLVPNSLYNNFMDAIELPSHEAQLHEFSKLVRMMPEAHFQTMKALMQHLSRVTQYACINLMNAKNLSVVFGPTLMRNPDPSKEIVDVTYKNLVVEFLILHTNELFATERIQPTEDVQGSPSDEDKDVKDVEDSFFKDVESVEASSVNGIEDDSGVSSFREIEVAGDSPFKEAEGDSGVSSFKEIEDSGVSSFKEIEDAGNSPFKEVEGGSEISSVGDAVTVNSPTLETRRLAVDNPTIDTS